MVVVGEVALIVAMESAGVYWKPIYAILEGAFEIVVANAQHVKKVFRLES
jgi:transposase